jgi:hypothetical protein
MRSKVHDRVRELESVNVDGMRDANTSMAKKSMNSLPVELEDLSEIIMRKIRESETNARSGFIQQQERNSKYRPYANNKHIILPPSRKDFANLCRALNLKISDRRCIEAILYIRGAEMEKSNPDEFKLEKLINWFQLNVQMLEHENMEIVDKEWLAENPHVLLTLSKDRVPDHMKE